MRISLLLLLVFSFVGVQDSQAADGRRSLGKHFGCPENPSSAISRTVVDCIHSGVTGAAKTKGTNTSGGGSNQSTSSGSSNTSNNTSSSTGGAVMPLQDDQQPMPTYTESPTFNNDDESGGIPAR